MPKYTKKKKEEFALLMKLNMRRAYYTALLLLGSHDDAMEISQQAFVNAYHHFAKFDVNKNFFTWYYKILRNLCFNYKRDKKKNMNIELFELEINSVNNKVQAEVELKDLHKILEAALFKLKKSDREILVLKEIENYTYKEIAEMLDIPIGSVMSKLFYARKRLAKKMKGLEQ